MLPLLCQFVFTEIVTPPTVPVDPLFDDVLSTLFPATSNTFALKLYVLLCVKPLYVNVFVSSLVVPVVVPFSVVRLVVSFNVQLLVPFSL